MSSKKKKSKRLRQTTLFENPASSPRASTSSTLSKPLPSRRTSGKRQRSPSSDEDSDGNLTKIRLEAKPIDISDGDSDENPSPSKKKRLVRSQKVVVSDDEEKPIHKRRRLAKRRAVESSESDEDLADEVEKKHILKERLRTRGKKTAFQKSLERLKRKKQGKPMESSSESEEEEGSESDDRNAPFKGARPSSEQDRDSLFDGSSSDSSGSSNFIVEDEGEAVSLPMQFSMETHQDLDHQFKKIYQFFVHIAVRAGPLRKEFMKEQMDHQEYFAVPLKIVRRKLSGIRDSLVTSSIWRPDYKNKLEKYPEFDLLRLDFSVPDCDACHLSSRVSTLMGRLSGVPYDRWGFELDERYLGGGDSDSDGDCPSTVEFHLGRFCGRRTRVFHEFSHWEWYLFKSIIDELDELQDFAKAHGKRFYKVAFEGGKKPPKDLTDADGICEWLDQRGMIDRQWEKLKLMMKSAEHLEVAVKNREDEDD